METSKMTSFFLLFFFHLILDKLAGILQVHVLFAWRGVMGGQSQAAQRVPARPPLTDLGHQLLSQGWCECDFPCSHPQVQTPVDDALGSPLPSQTLIEPKRTKCTRNVCQSVCHGLHALMNILLREPGLTGVQ